MSIIMEHGDIYFLAKDILCPECRNKNFLIHKISALTISIKPANGIYQFICKNCACKWQEVVDE